MEAGLRFERMEMRLADLWPKRWFNAFVPEARRKAAKKVCFSGRRHTGALWQAFAQGYLPALEGEAARAAWHAFEPEQATLFLPDEGLLYRIEGSASPDGLAMFESFMLTDEALTVTFVRTAAGQEYCHIDDQ